MKNVTLALRTLPPARRLTLVHYFTFWPQMHFYRQWRSFGLNQTSSGRNRNKIAGCQLFPRVTAPNLPLPATWGLSSSSARMDQRSPDGRILSPEVCRVLTGKGERCTSRRWPQLLCLARASCWLWPDPSLPRALSFPAGLGARMGPGMLSVSLASRTNNRRWRHPRSFSLLMIRSKDDFPSPGTSCGCAQSSSSIYRQSKGIEQNKKRLRGWV